MILRNWFTFAPSFFLISKNSVISKIEITAAECKNYQTTYYRLEIIFAFGYPVNSSQASQFWIWATNTLKECISKRFVLDDERLNHGKNFGVDYFEE